MLGYGGEALIQHEFECIMICSDGEGAVVIGGEAAAAAELPGTPEPDMIDTRLLELRLRRRL